MYVVSVTIHVNRESVKDFIAATLKNARNTIREPVNIRFDVHQAEDDPKRFLLYEVYRDKEGFAAHQKTEHYLEWRATVADWMAEPRQGVKHNSLFPEDPNW